LSAATIQVASDRLERDLDDGGAWDQLFSALVDDGRADEALCGLELATEAGLMTAERYVRLVHCLRARREHELAHLVALLGCIRFPDAAGPWTTLGYLCLEEGDETLAERAHFMAARSG
jgi:hypothetical protein